MFKNKDSDKPKMLGFDLFSLAQETETAIWLGHITAYRAFRAVTTQWIVGAGGATGLNYVPLFRVMDELGVKGDEWLELLDDVKVLEAEVLTAMHEKTD